MEFFVQLCLPPAYLIWTVLLNADCNETYIAKANAAGTDV